VSVARSPIARRCSPFPWHVGPTGQAYLLPPPYLFSTRAIALPDLPNPRTKNRAIAGDSSHAVRIRTLALGITLGIYLRTPGAPRMAARGSAMAGRKQPLQGTRTYTSFGVSASGLGASNRRLDGPCGREGVDRPLWRHQLLIGEGRPPRIASLRGPPSPRRHGW
jgi:hypothetical protein